MAVPHEELDPYSERDGSRIEQSQTFQPGD